MGINLLALKLIIIDCHATWYAIQEKWSQWFLNMILISLELARLVLPCFNHRRTSLQDPSVPVGRAQRAH